MPDNNPHLRGKRLGWKNDRGGTPADTGPFLGTVKNNVDPTRSGRLEVFIEQFAGTDPENPSLWRKVSYLPPYYGTTDPPPNNKTGVGSFTQNLQSYGMWFTPPDIGTEVICFFVAGDPERGFYVGCLPWQGIQHMIPAIGASTKYQLANGPQDAYFQGAKQLPVTEINVDNQKLSENPQYYDQARPVHSYLAGIMLQQGLIKDIVRGPITSNSQRESPSAVFGVSTPGRPIYQGGLTDADIKTKLERGQLKPQNIEVIARRGGHSIVMDDGNLEGQDNLVRIRTSKGHQITMSDDGDCFYIIHANGQTWIELGKEGTVDVFSTNSVNVRTKGTINLHADQDINMFAGRSINVKSQTMKLQASATLDLIANGSLTIYGKGRLGLLSDGTLTLKSSQGGWDGGSSLKFSADCISLNSGNAGSVSPPTPIKETSLPDTSFKENQGWVVNSGALKSIVTRAPTHEPYPYHNQGVSASASFNPTAPTSSELITDKMAKLASVPVTNGITVADLAAQPDANLTFGDVSREGATATLAQCAKTVDQPFDEYSVEKGIGKYGLSPESLQLVGILKPGAAEIVKAFAESDPNNMAANFTKALQDSGLYTGLRNINNITGILSNVLLQSDIQNEILVGASEGLKRAGIITGREEEGQLASIVQNAAKFGVDNAVKWLKNEAPAEIATAMDKLGKDTQYAVNLAKEKISELMGAGEKVTGAINTLDRTAINAAIAGVINGEFAVGKVPPPNFGSGPIQDT